MSYWSLEPVGLAVHAKHKVSKILEALPMNVVDMLMALDVVLGPLLAVMNVQKIFNRGEVCFDRHR